MTYEKLTWWGPSLCSYLYCWNVQLLLQSMKKNFPESFSCVRVQRQAFTVITMNRKSENRWLLYFYKYHRPLSYKTVIGNDVWQNSPWCHYKTFKDQAKRHKTVASSAEQVPLSCHHLNISFDNTFYFTKSEHSQVSALRNAAKDWHKACHSIYLLGV